jgi:hypothetical protein
MDNPYRKMLEEFHKSVNSIRDDEISDTREFRRRLDNLEYTVGVILTKLGEHD